MKKLTIYKKGEMLTGYKKDFVYEERYLKGASFHVYAAENISCMRLPHLRTANMIQQSSIIWWKQKHWMDTHWIRPSMK